MIQEKQIDFEMEIINPGYFTGRQVQILNLLINDYSRQEVADLLTISKATVNAHIDGREQGGAYGSLNKYLNMLNQTQEEVYVQRGMASLIYNLFYYKMIDFVNHHPFPESLTQSKII